MTDSEEQGLQYEPGHDLHLEHEDATIRLLHRIIRVAVKILAILTVGVFGRFTGHAY